MGLVSEALISIENKNDGGTVKLAEICDRCLTIERIKKYEKEGEVFFRVEFREYPESVCFINQKEPSKVIGWLLNNGRYVGQHILFRRIAGDYGYCRYEVYDPDKLAPQTYKHYGSCIDY